MAAKEGRDWNGEPEKERTRKWGWREMKKDESDLMTRGVGKEEEEEEGEE